MSAAVADVVAVRVPERSWRSELRAIQTIWRREMIRFFSDRMQMAMWLVQPLLFLFVLGSGLRSLSAASTHGVDFKTFVFPGVLCMGAMFTAMFNAGSLVWDRELGFLRELMVAPVSRSSIIVGKCLGGATIAASQGVIVLALAGLVGVPYDPLLLLGAVGIGNALEDVAGETLLQRLVSDDMLGRVLGVLFGGATAGIAIGSVATPGLISGLGVKGALVAVGAFLPSLVLLSWRGLARIDRSAVPPAAELSLLERVPMFAPLPIAAKEQLARDLVHVVAPKGRVVVREGDEGDRFYIVASGHLVATQNGRRLRELGPGDSFGEIALLRDVPRTATVTAADDVELYALERADFIDAATGHAAGRLAGEQVVRERLAEPAGV
jgi:hypothetical protein